MFTIIPRRATKTTVEVLAVALYETARPRVLDLFIEDYPRRIAVGDWSHIDGGRSDPIYWCVISIDKLEANRSYGIQLQWGNERLAKARFETLPDALPVGEEGSGSSRPFTLWLSSCFAVRQAQAGLGDVIERVFSSPQLRPHLNCHVGDQVYLDELWVFIYTALTEQKLRTRFNDEYASTFSHPDFSRLLSSASNHFLADDHELWNNYPHDPFDIPLRSTRFWRRWFRLAYFERCLPLQSPATFEGVELSGDLSIRLVDFRVGRSQDGLRLCDPDQMERVVRWIEGLQTPGVLITQQPVISSRGAGGDRKLPDYRQYWRHLLPAIHDCKQDLIVLAGDVHHGLVARTFLGDPDQPAADHPPQLIQIIASPLALVNPIASSSPEPALRHFPGGKTASPRPIEYPLRVPTYDSGRHTRRCEDHAMTISFWRRSAGDGGRAGGIGMRVRTWLTRSATRSAMPSWETTLHCRRGG